MRKAKYLYRYEGIKIVDGWEHPITKTVYTRVKWFDSQSQDSLPVNVTRHDWPSIPEYDCYHQNAVEQVTGDYIIEDLPLENVKKKKKSEINAMRNKLESDGFLYLGRMFDSDERSAHRMQVAALSAQSSLNSGAEFSINWTAQDNSEVTLDAGGVFGMIEAFAIAGRSIFEQAKALKKQVDNCVVGEDVAKIEWVE